MIKAINQAPIVRYGASQERNIFPSLLAFLEFRSYPAITRVNKGVIALSSISTRGPPMHA